MVEKCVVGVCFTALDPGAPKFFGFAEYLTGIALMVIAWTIGDVRYRFRVRIAPIPLMGITYWVVSAVGILTLLTDLWRAQGWLVPRGNIFSPASWQAFLGGLFLVTFLTWALFAFIKPPSFGRWNAKRYFGIMFAVIVKGSQAELSVIADELTRSAKALVASATDRGAIPPFGAFPPFGVRPVKAQKAPSMTEAFANQILLLIADKRFCRSVVETSPGTAWALFYEIGQTKKYRIQIETFANNLVNEALKNKDSFFYHETSGYDTGLIGYRQPLSQAMFSNYSMVETIGTMLDTDYAGRSKWDAEQWEAYCRIVLITFKNYVEIGNQTHSYTLYRAFDDIKYAAMDLYKLNSIPNGAWDNDIMARLRAVTNFVKEVIEILDKKGIPNNLRKRLKDEDRYGNKTFFDFTAELIYELILAASAVSSPADLCWSIQHNLTWDVFFNFDHLSSKAGEVVKFKVCRLLYEDLEEMARFPNFKGARILGYCLNVMGLERSKEHYYKDSRALHKAILLWTKKNYARVYNYNPRVGEACLVDGMSWDAESLRIVRTYPAIGLRRVPKSTYLQVDPPIAPM